MFVPETSQYVWSRSCNNGIVDFLASDQILGAIGGVGVVFGLIEVRRGTRKKMYSVVYCFGGKRRRLVGNGRQGHKLDY